MSVDSLLSPKRLDKLIADDRCIVVDCRFDLVSTSKGWQEYLTGHIPGARHADMNRDLSSPVTTTSGRHPLPDAVSFANFLSRIGWDKSRLLVAHDDRSNAFAARLWWLMRYFGQDAALLDGGLEAWTRAGMPLEQNEVVTTASAVPVLQSDESMIVTAPEILEDIGHFSMQLVDARAPERFSGEVEPLDAKAGHIPGARNRPFGLNLDELGCFKPAAQLQQEFRALLQDRSVSSVVHSCGSGVTACHNLFAMELAGLRATRVYPGSWSEWSRDETHPVETSV